MWGWPTIATTSEKVDSVNVLIPTDRDESIYEQQGISVGTTHKLVPDEATFFKAGSPEEIFYDTVWFLKTRSIPSYM